MANLDFYAVRDDQLSLLNFIYEETDCRIYESYSQYDRELRSFGSAEEVEEVFSLGEDPTGNGNTVLLQLWSPSTGGVPVVKRIDLSISGYSYRYAIQGWGLMQLYLGGIAPSGISHSHFGHSSEARVRRWEASASELGTVEQWNWKSLAQVSRRIQYQIRQRLAKAKYGSRPILRHAEVLWHEGANLL